MQVFIFKGWNNKMACQHSKKYLCKITLMLFAWLLMQGCEVRDKSAIPMPEKPYKLQHDTTKLKLHFYQNKLVADDQEQFIGALKPSGPGKSSIHLTIPSNGSHLGKTRLKDVIQIALQNGLKAKQIHRSHDLPSAKEGAIEILLDTYRAIPPLCPNWSSTYGRSHDRGTTSNFGCSTATNFLLMIDDPIVLFKAEPSLGRDAARDSSAIADYRAGKDKGKWLKNEKYDSGSSGSSSGSGSSGGGGSS